MHKFLSEAAVFKESFSLYQAYQNEELPKRNLKGINVVVVPAFLTTNKGTEHLRNYISSCRAKVRPANIQGFNTGLYFKTHSQIRHQLKLIHLNTGNPTYLVGWSMGGMYSRWLANTNPELVAGVITLGSPFLIDYSTDNAFVISLYEKINNKFINEGLHALDNMTHMPEGVKSYNIYSSVDGVVHHSFCNHPNEDSIDLNCSHIGMTHNPKVFVEVINKLHSWAGA